MIQPPGSGMLRAGVSPARRQDDDKKGRGRIQRKTSLLNKGCMGLKVLPERRSQ
jgi:hypothetical protein